MSEKRKEYNRVIVEGNVAIKPYFYVRGKHLHVKFSSDKCVELTDNELHAVYQKLTEHPEKKQDILEDMWSLVANIDNRPLLDGVKVADKNMEIKRHCNG